MTVSTHAHLPVPPTPHWLFSHAVYWRPLVDRRFTTGEPSLSLFNGRLQTGGLRALSCLLRFIPPSVWSWECKLVCIYLHFPRCLSSLLMQHDAACWSVKDHKNQVYLGGSDVDPNRHPALVDLTCFIWYWIRLYGINGDCWAFAEVCTLMRVILILDVIFRA